MEKKTKKIKEENKKDEKVKSHPLLKGPRMTEKSALASERGVYTFNIKKEASKNEIKKAIKIVYGVTPVKISITKISEKVVVRRGKAGIKPGGKKAVVYLKKGDKITFV
jgi:large subunit ribosomal protein L23